MQKDYSTKEQGFTLIELMIIIAIIGILAAIAVLSYNGQLVRTKVTEGLQLASPAKTMIASSIATRDDLLIVANSWNQQAHNRGVTSKYVDSVLIDNDTGIITISYNAANVGVATDANQLILIPWVRSDNGQGMSLKQSIAQGKSGSLDWGCISSTKKMANASHIDATIPHYALQNIYAPAQCR